MKGTGRTILIILISIVVLGLVCGGGALSGYKNTWNNLNQGEQEVLAAKSRYSAALNMGAQKISGTWATYSQYMDHESQTFTSTAALRSGIALCNDSFQQLVNGNGSTKDLTRLGDQAIKMASQFALNVNAVRENYPTLKADRIAQDNIRVMQEAINEMKAALDDWIQTIKLYNRYRGSFWVNIFGSAFQKFPDKMEYYEGNLQDLDVNSLNPRSN